MKSCLILILYILHPSSSCICGQSKSTSDTWTVSVMTHFGDYKSWACGGSVINDRFILTSAKCVRLFPPEMISVVVGAKKVNETMTIPSLPVSHIIVHEKYQRYFRRRRKHVFNDVALLKLKDPLNMDVVNPVCLPSTPEDPPSKGLFVSGWAAESPGGHFPSPPHLIDSSVKVMDSKSCSRFYSNILRFDPRMTICAGGIRGVCFKDEGSPLLTHHNGHVYQLGLVSVSRGFADCRVQPKVPTIFEKISSHIEWIKNKASDSRWCWSPSTIHVPSNYDKKELDDDLNDVKEEDFQNVLKEAQHEMST